MHTEAISDPLWELIKDLDPIPEMKRAYLGGGTALALQLRHRKSDVLDFFFPEEFNETSFLNALRQYDLRSLVVHRTPNHTELLIRSLKIDLIKEQLPLKFPLKAIDPEIKNIRTAHAIDIVRIKLLSVGRRGSKKDFVDLYCITREQIKLESLIKMAMKENRGVKYSKLLFLKGLVDFEEADVEPDPLMLWDITWQKVKRTLTREVKDIASQIE